MALAIGLGIVYVVANVAVTRWLGARLATGRITTREVAIISTVVRYGPILIAVAYIVAAGGSWWLIPVVGVFVVFAFWMLDGLLGYGAGIGALGVTRPIGRERKRHGKSTHEPHDLGQP